jgi:hypothetical protein
MNEANLEAKLVIQGTFECRDKDGNLLKTIELKGEMPVNTKEDDGDQRSE